MGYRDVSESLRGYRDRIAKDLDEARQAAKEASERAGKVGILERELAETDGLLDKLGGKRRGLPMLDSLQVAAPCKASWESMVGDEHVRFCGQCEKNVYNLSSLPREEAEALLVAREGSLCIRMFKRQDGTVLTSDCPVGVKKRRRRRLAAGVVGGGLMAAAAAVGLESTYMTGKPAMPMMGEPMPMVMGSVAPVAPPAPAPTLDPLPTGTAAGAWTAGTAPLMGKPAAPTTSTAGQHVLGQR